ncbi:tetratricopeptide repeat protein [Aliiroseovarius sp. CAU 1755]
MTPLRLFFARQIGATLVATASVFALTATASQADNTAGSYLAARHADLAGDYPRVVEYGTRALAEDAERLDIIEGLVVAHTALGEIDKAIPFARRLAGLSPDNQLAGLVLLADAIQAENWNEATELLNGKASIAPMIDAMISAWASLGEGRMSQALTIFDELASDEGSRSFALFQKALALAHVGDFEGAAKIFGGEDGPLQLNRRGIISYAQILSQLDRHDDAVELLKANSGETRDAEVEDLLTRLEAREVIAFSGIQTPKDGIAELMFALAESLASGADPTVVLLYNRVSEHLNPDQEGALLLSAQLLESMEHYDLALEAYARIPKDSVAYPQAALGRTDVLRRWEKLEEATEELRALADDYPETPRFRVALGDTLMQQDRFDEARAAYDIAIGAFTQELPGQWATYFQRAIALTKIGEWPAAEADFRKALELSPEQPAVLNYLGYTYVEKRINLDEALSMIERAVEARPDSGFIVDSLGWVLFRLGRYDEAVQHMERAVELMPVDPILNDHLGDTYWAVGRKREARFQWSRALSFVTDDTDLTEMNPDRVRRKLAVGLDAVLADEGAAPLHQPE